MPSPKHPSQCHHLSHRAFLCILCCPFVPVLLYVASSLPHTQERKHHFNWPYGMYAVNMIWEQERVGKLPVLRHDQGWLTPVGSWLFLEAVDVVLSGRNAWFLIISGTPGCLREGKFSAECEVELAALNDVDDADEAGGLTGSFSSKILDLCFDGVEITLPFFRDSLPDNPVDSADALSEWSAGVAVDGEKGKKGGKTAGKTAWDGEANKLEFLTLCL
ncbi:hypothetical protein DFH07DRAFT_765665 [Mycena maculata]|uniref:Uncharacterized protein n=1 Tax=Mycena maculata TaxID=230809 RepID=A0AAD7NXK3_9AGAR|nr:hypothetical protein DFH07DRAFT_765665 [Mycena maculata]